VLRDWFGLGLALALAMSASNMTRATEVDLVLNEENARQGVKQAPLPAASDLAFLRRIYVDLIARIPTEAEIREFEAWPADTRRDKIIDKLMADPRFLERWTVFFEDMLRLRTNATGGAALISFVHKSLSENMPYDELARRLLVANGKAGRTPEVGFILGDDADPLAMASVTAQVFLGTRIGCAQCHDHPFDVWKRQDFYGMAAYFGKTRRVESQLTRVVYTTEADQSTVMWPPDENSSETRKPMAPRFPFPIEEDNGSLRFLARLSQLRAPKETKVVKNTGASVDDLLADADTKVKNRVGLGGDGLDPQAEAKKDIRKIDIQASLQSQSELRIKLAELVTSPRNRYFARNLVNRMWKELIGRGFVEPIDDFRKDNPPSHPVTLDYLSEEFVANGYDLRYLIKAIVRTEVYRRSRAPSDTEDAVRQELEVAFLATPMRRMISESLYDSIVTAGHLFEFKHPAGANEVVTYEKIRVPKSVDGKPVKLATPMLFGGRPMAGMAGMAGAGMAGNGPGYGLEDAIELDFSKVLDEEGEEVAVEQMRVMSREELEAERMTKERMARGEGVEYVEKTIKRVADANPKFNTSLKMESPAPQGHFLRVFGQPTRQDLGEARDESATMRQALMMLNGRLTHEASRVGPLEPVAALLQGERPDVPAAIRMAYREIMTRQPSAAELSEAREIVAGAATPLEGLADLRWVLLNCNEFRFLP